MNRIEFWRSYSTKMTWKTFCGFSALNQLYNGSFSTNHRFSIKLFQKLLEKLGFNAKLGTDILATFEYTFLCGKSATNYELSVCGHSNPTRQYGEVQLVSRK